MEFKMITRQTLPQVLDLWDYCFEKKEEPFFKWYFENYCLKNNLILGGFSEAEVALCREHGVLMAGMGPRILRTETAAIASLALLMYEHGDLGG